ncbi:SDR family NAD(P)-dependent oxidoreductase [Paenibacillus lemnae]|uniref:SDR family oxidoreductase n=1 Tax=Paenibacillus lemnae TaxID=1330551 RepID=A0A848MAZ3_PAELE|nr:SDR family oxidoreductase [Paenibacillus lemnae]NMO97835.1 SDR family oxidoreductase [Paenibacillus lemnae]
MNIDLNGKLALVTGGAGQLGRVMVRSLAECGADVIIHYRSSAAKAEELRNEVKQTGNKVMIVQADIASLESVMQMKEQIQSHFGRLPEITVANAVEQYEWTSVLEQDPKDYQSQFETCVMQSVYLAKAFVPAMVERKYGRFIGINTECSMQNHPGQSAYVAGKRGMDGVYRVLAKEVGEHGITVNQVAPGWTVSDRDRDQGSEHNASYEASVPLGRRGTDQEIANMVAFLASDLASFTTGAYIPVCGGNIMPAI